MAGGAATCGKTTAIRWVVRIIDPVRATIGFRNAAEITLFKVLLFYSVRSLNFEFYSERCNKAFDLISNSKRFKIVRYKNKFKGGDLSIHDY